MHDPARLAHVRLADQPERLLVGLAAMDEHRLSGPPRQRELAPERALLGLARCQVAKEVEAGLADRDDPGCTRQTLELREGKIVGLGGLVRMDAHGRPYVGLADGQCRRGA